MDSLSGKVAVVTGAASGIGLGMARALAAAEMKVMLADIEAPVLEQAVEKLRAEGAQVASVVCDVSDRASVEAAAEATLDAFGRVHVLCNNAGVSSGGLVDELPQEDWDWVIGVNYLGVLHGCQAFLPHIKRQQEGGHVVNTSSMAGLLASMAGWGPYNSTKFAVVGLTEVLRREGKQGGGFSASALCPGGVNTHIFDSPRNRPARFGPQRSKVAYGDENLAAELRQALDPAVVGELVVEAIRADRLFVFTDPRFRGMVERRHARILEDFEWAAGSDALTRAGAPGAAGKG